MRYYRLMIGGMIFAKLDELDTKAPRLTWQIQGSVNADIPSAMVTIYNIAPEYFKKEGLASFIGKPLFLEAGLKTSPTLKKMKIIPPMNNVVLRGYIVNAIGNPFLQDGNSLTFWVFPSPLSPTAKLGAVCDIKEGDLLKEKFKLALQTLYPTSIIKIEGVSVVSNFKEKLEFYSLDDIVKKAKEKKIYIYTSSDGFVIADSLIPPSSVVVLKPTDFLEQPQQLSYSLYSFTLYERGDIYINSIIQVPQNFLYQSKISEKLLGVSSGLFLTGQFQVVSVWHIGDSCSINGNAWALNIEAIPLGV